MQQLVAGRHLDPAPNDNRRRSTSKGMPDDEFAGQPKRGTIAPASRWCACTAGQRSGQPTLPLPLPAMTSTEAGPSQIFRKWVRRLTSWSSFDSMHCLPGPESLTRQIIRTRSTPPDFGTSGGSMNAISHLRVLLFFSVSAPDSPERPAIDAVFKGCTPRRCRRLRYAAARTPWDNGRRSTCKGMPDGEFGEPIQTHAESVDRRPESHRADKQRSGP